MIKKKLNVAIFTGSRAEYGLMRYLIASIENHPHLCLQLMVGGAHLSAIHGRTIREIEADQHLPAALIPVSLDQQPPPEMAILTAETIHGVSDAILRLKPDLLVVLGDRYETFGAASAAHLHRLPICHLHGGETTEGAIDDRLRHAITQLSTWHFCAADQYRQRIIAMGHPADHVTVTGPMILDALIHEKKISRQDFESQTEFRFGGTNLIATFHPETLRRDHGIKNLETTLELLESTNIHILFTLPNADEGHEKISRRLQQFCKNHSHRAWVTSSLGQKKYLSALQLFDGMLGNSSSGVIEAPLVNLPVLNIGDRQKGRIRFGQVFEGGLENHGIDKGIRDLLSAISKRSSHLSSEPSTHTSPTKKIVSWLEDII